jgi:hypothetical protein
MVSRGSSGEGGSVPLATIAGIEWDNETPCQVCDDTVYTRVTIVVSGSLRIVLCPFCLALAIDRATGWKVWKVMASWENTRKIHAALKADRLNLDGLKRGTTADRTQSPTSRTEP